MILGFFWRGKLGVQIHRFRPVFFRSLILKNQRPRLLVRSFPVLVRSSLRLFPVLGLDFQTLVDGDISPCLDFAVSCCNRSWRTLWISGKYWYLLFKTIRPFIVGFTKLMFFHQNVNKGWKYLFTLHLQDPYEPASCILLLNGKIDATTHFSRFMGVRVLWV